MEAEIDKEGWYNLAKHKPADPGRVGKHTSPRAVVIHSTDMLPRTHNALVRSWTTQRGEGNAAHFLIGRTPEEGITQFVSCLRSANHAGGKLGGGVLIGDKRRIGWNLASIGIEVHNPGALRLDKGFWCYDGEPFRDADDPEVEAMYCRGWLKYTDYQMEAVSTLIQTISVWPWFQPLPEYATISIDGNETPKAWARVSDPVLVGHATINPMRKSDPGPNGFRDLISPNLRHFRK